jgi:hypothetical protein
LKFTNHMQPQTRLISPASFSRRGSIALEFKGMVRPSDMVMNIEI